MYLHNLLEEVFQDKDTALILLKKYDLIEALEKAIDAIKKVLDKPPVSVSSLAGLAPSVLFAVNSRLGSVNDSTDKLNLEILVSDVAHHLIKKLMDECKQPVTALREIKNALKSATDFGIYNFDSLLTLLKYDVLEKLYYKDETYWYDWQGKLHELDELSDKLKKLKNIKSVKDFKKLFESHNNPELRVELSSDSAPFLIALFDELKDKELIIPRGGTGHFHPLRVYGFNPKGEFLMKNEPRFIKKNAKRHPKKWAKIENKAKELVAPIMTLATSRPPRPDEGQMDRLVS
jgi:hypothetical protein